MSEHIESYPWYLTDPYPGIIESKIETKETKEKKSKEKKEK